MEINRTGCTRIVILTRNYAFKVPNVLYGWRLFLYGLLANMQERAFGKAEPLSPIWPELCPVLWSIPGGWLVVMPRVRMVTRKEFESFDFARFIDFNPDRGYALPVEGKEDDFGWLNGRIVAVDYGS